MMYIKVNWQEIENCGNRFGRCGNLLNQYNNNVQSARRSLSWQMRMETNYDDRLQTLGNRMTGLQRSMNELKSKAAEVARYYRDMELRLRGEPVPEDETTEDGSTDFQLWNLIGGGGTVGGLVDGILDVVHSNDPMGVQIPGILQDTLELFQDIGELVEGGGANWWETVFGLQNMAANFSTNSNVFSQMWGRYWDRYSFSNNTTLSSNLGTLARWAGLLAIGVETGYGNWQEYQSGAISAERAVGEFVIETGSEILIHAGATVAVAAGAVALVGTAHAIVVAGGAYLVTWGLDAISESVFGVEASELIADTVMDGVEWLGEQAESISATITEGVQDTVEWVGDRLDDAGEAISDGFEAARDWVASWF